MGKNTQRLGNVLASRMTKTARANAHTFLELGIINGDMSLTTDSLNGKIGPDDYMIALRFTHYTYYTYNELNSSAKKPHIHEFGEHSHGVGIPSGAHIHDQDGLHDHRVPSVFRKIEPGDRVLVAWVGNEPIIIEIVVAGTTITKND